MNHELSPMDFARIRHWQVIDPAPEFLKMLEPPMVARIYQARIRAERELLKVGHEVSNRYLEEVDKMLEDIVRKG